MVTSSQAHKLRCKTSRPNRELSLHFCSLPIHCLQHSLYPSADAPQYPQTARAPSVGCYKQVFLSTEHLAVVHWAAKSWLIWKDPDAGKDWGQEEKGTTEGEMAGWHHWLHGHGFGWTPGVGDGQGGLACCGSWGRKESDTTERLKWIGLEFRFYKMKGLCGWTVAMVVRHYEYIEYQ